MIQNIFIISWQKEKMLRGLKQNMTIAYNPKITTSGLLAYYDAANPKSWTGSGSWKDLSGNRNELPNNGSVTTSTLGGATAMNFDSDGKFFENTTAFSGTSPLLMQLQRLGSIPLQVN